MTESEWLTCREPQAMLLFLRNSEKASDRKLRLFAVACCRRMWSFCLKDAVRVAIITAERFADGEASGEELTQAADHAKWYRRGYPFGARARAAVRACSIDAHDAAGATNHVIYAVYAAAKRS